MTRRETVDVGGVPISYLISSTTTFAFGVALHRRLEGLYLLPYILRKRPFIQATASFYVQTVYTII